MRKFLILMLAILSICGQAEAGILVDIPMDQQIDIGLGPAISGFSSFGSDPGGGFVRRLLTSGNGAGGWYFGPTVDLVKAGYGPYVDMSVAGTTVQYDGRYYQGGGNPSPYSDAPIFIYLTDQNGKRRGLGISYGPQPWPRYPSWITCTDDMTPSDWPADAGFDISKVTKVTFFGTDWSGVGDDFVDLRKLKIINPIVYEAIPISAAKALPDGSPVEVSGIVSATFSSLSQFYIQDTKGSCGIQVRNATQPTGGLIYVSGQVGTDPSTGEMYIQATEWSQGGSGGTATPIALVSRSLGGSSFERQVGVWDGLGLNNIGLLVKLFGIVTGIGPDYSYFYIDDGSGVSDGGGYQGVKVDLSAIPIYQRPQLSAGAKVTVTGISSMYSSGGRKYRCVRVASASSVRDLDDNGNRPRTFRVLVLNFDPIVPSRGVRTSVAFGWNNPHTLTDGYIADLRECSYNWANYQVVEWIDLNYHPVMEDGFQYSPQEYYDLWSTCGASCNWHRGTADYARIISDFNIAARVASGEIDEVFMFDGPYASGFYESRMAGPGAYWCNAPGMPEIQSGRLFIMMGFNPERGVDCMLEDFGHRTESIMWHVYGSWNTYPPQHNWDLFTLYDKRIINHNLYTAGCGNVHYAPNSQSDYDWGNPTYVWSTCDDWLYNWPNLQGTKKWVNRTEWGGGDMRLHHKWWLKHIPHAVGVNPDGKQNNWWKYMCDFNNYPESR